MQKSCLWENLLKNVVVLYKIAKSQWKARKIIKEFKPHVVVGVGGYASGPTLKTAGQMGIPTLIQEQNSYAGVTNKLLAKSAKKICVAYDGMERFFPAEKIIKTGNPVRQNLLDAKVTKAEATESFGLDPKKRTVLVIGGSLGARTVNESILQHIEDIRGAKNVQFIWQTGKYYSEEIHMALAKEDPVQNMKVTDFISNMDNAYAAADLVISRAGASSISCSNTGPSPLGYSFITSAAPMQPSPRPRSGRNIHPRPLHEKSLAAIEYSFVSFEALRSWVTL